MTVVLERWNDDKMDGLAAKVDGLGGKVDGLAARVDSLDRQLSEQREDLREQRQDLREHRKETKEGFESLHRTLIQTTVATLTGLIVGFSALVGLIATQL